MERHVNHDWIITVTHHSGSQVTLGSNDVTEIALWVSRQIEKRKPTSISRTKDCITFLNDITIVIAWWQD